MRSLIPQSMFAVLTGTIGSGKSYQITSVLKAKTKPPNGCPPEAFAQPALYLLAEPSGEGTAGEVLLDPGACVVWPCADCEDALEALRRCFPESGPVTLGQAKTLAQESAASRASKSGTAAAAVPATSSGHDNLPLRSIVVDTMSTLYQGSVAAAYREFLAAATGGNKATALRNGGKGAEYNNPLDTNRMAAKRCVDLIDRLNGIGMRNRGMIVLVSCHTAPAVEIRGQEAVCVGEAPYLGATKPRDAGVRVPSFSATWNSLAAKANVIWHCFETTPDLRGSEVARINTNTASSVAAGYGVITKKGTYPGLGEILWVKRQNGDGPLGIFGTLPAYWHPAADVPEEVATSVSQTPDLGRVLAFAIEACAG